MAQIAACSRVPNSRLWVIGTRLQARLFCRCGRVLVDGTNGVVVLDIPAELRPPAPASRGGAGVATARVLARISLEAWTEAHFEQPVVTSGLSIGRVAVVSDPAAIRRVLLENCDNSEKDSAGLIGHN